MAFWHLFLGLLISTISLTAAIIFLATTSNAGLRYFYVAWVTISAASVWVLVCASSILWFRRHEGAMGQEPRTNRIGRTIFSVCWPNGSQRSFHSYHRDAFPSTRTPRLPSRLCHFSWTSFADIFAASARHTGPSPQPTESAAQREWSCLPLPPPPAAYATKRDSHLASFSIDSGISIPRSSIGHTTSKTRLIYPDSNGFFHNPSISPLSQTSILRNSAVSALSLDTDVSPATWQTASVMRSVRPQTVDISPPRSCDVPSTIGSGSTLAKRDRVEVDENGSPRRLLLQSAGLGAI